MHVRMCTCLSARMPCACSESFGYDCAVYVGNLAGSPHSGTHRTALHCTSLHTIGSAVSSWPGATPDVATSASRTQWTPWNPLGTRARIRKRMHTRIHKYTCSNTYHNVSTHAPLVCRRPSETEVRQSGASQTSWSKLLRRYSPGQGDRSSQRHELSQHQISFQIMRGLQVLRAEKWSVTSHRYQSHPSTHADAVYSHVHSHARTHKHVYAGGY